VITNQDELPEKSNQHKTAPDVDLSLAGMPTFTDQQWLTEKRPAGKMLDQTYMKQCREVIAGVFLCCVARTDIKYVASQRSNGRQ